MTNKTYSNLSGWEAQQGNASLPSEPPVRSSELVVLLARWREDASKIDKQIEDAKMMELNEGDIWLKIERAAAIRKCADELEWRMRHNDQAQAIRPQPES